MATRKILLTAETPHGTFTRTTHRPYAVVGVGETPCGWGADAEARYGHVCDRPGFDLIVVWGESATNATKNLRRFTGTTLGIYPVQGGK